MYNQGLRICNTQTTQLHTENPVDYTPVGQVIAPYVSLVAIFIAAIVIGYVTDLSVQAGDQVQTLVQSLPPAEIGTAHTTERHERLQHRNS